MTHWKVASILAGAILAASCTSTAEPTTTTTTTTVPSKYMITNTGEAEDWADSAVTLGRDESWGWNSLAEARESAKSHALSTCLALSQGKDPAVVEADFRAKMTVQAWVAYGSVWWDALLNGLCIRR